MTRISDPNYLVAPLRSLNQEFLRRCDLQIGENVIRNFETLRTRLRHATLFLKGRATLDVVNQIMTIAQEEQIAQSDNNIVTWSTSSPHLPDMNGLSHAFDIAVYRDGQPTWDETSLSLYLRAADIGRELGLECGADWPRPRRDLPHYQLRTSVRKEEP